MNADETPNSGSRETLFFRNVHLLGLTVVVLLLAGLSALTNLPRLEDPRITTRNAIVLTVLPGASAARVETLVTDPLEDRLEELDEIKELKSTSRAGISVITIEIDDAFDASNNEEALSKIRDKLGDAQADLPPGAGKPVFDDQRGAVAFSLITALTWRQDGEPPLGLLGRLSEDLADDLRNVGGTELVRVYGAPEEEIVVTVDRDELAAQGLAAAQIADAIAQADPKGAAGAVRSDRRDLFLEVAGELDSASRIRDLAIKRGHGGRVVRMGDIADVERHWRQPATEMAYIDGARTVFVAAKVESSVRVDKWMSGAQVKLNGFRARLDEGVEMHVVFDQSRYTTERLSGLSTNLLLGALVVMLAVLIGMGWRAALIVGLALPLSSFTALFGLTFFDQQIHQMTIFGLIIAIGLLIDNAIVVTDEIQNQLSRGRDRMAAVAHSVRHLFAPLLASTLTTILGFMPIFLLPGNVGDFVGPIAISVVLALAASLFISVTVISALAGRFLSTGTASRWWHSGLQTPALSAAAQNLLTWLFRRPGAAVAGATVLPIAGFVMAGTLGLMFFPPADRDQFEIEMWLPNDASIARTAGTARRVENAVRSLHGVKQVSWLVGGSHPTVYYNRIMKQDNNPSYGHAIVTARSAARAKTMVAELQELLDEGFPDAQIVVSPFAQGPPVDAPVGFKIAGPSLARLEQLGEDLRRVMHTVPQITHTRASVTSRPKLSYEADQTEAELAGLSLDELAVQLQGNLEGFTGGTVLEDLEELPVRIRYGSSERASLENISSMQLVSSTASRWIPADSIGNMKIMPERASISRENGERVNVVHGYVTRGALPIEVAKEITSRLEAEGFALPQGYRLLPEGDSESQREAVGQLLTYLPVLGMLMVATIVLSFRSALLAAVIGTVAFLSAGLGMLSLWLGGYNLGFNPLIGSAGLIGVAINGTIVVLAALRADPDARAGNLDAVVRVTLREARHILVTTATTIGGFIPLLVFSSGEFWPPLAVVIAGGVGFSVTLSLVFTPAFYRMVCKRLGHTSDMPQVGSLTEAPA